MKPIYRRIVCVYTCAMIASGCTMSSDKPATTLLSVAERSGFQETSRYDDVRAFIDALAQQTPRVRQEMFGRSEEGRDLPLMVVGDPPASSPAQAAESRLPIVFVMANIHAGEVEGKEAVLHLARRLTIGDLQPLMKSAVWLFAPIYNADGNEKVSLDNRSEQYGPIGGVGTRENAKGLDLNRDFMKLESSEARALVGLLTRWNPDVFVDLHTTNGSHHGYHLTYAPSFNPNSDPRILAFVRERLLPQVRDQVARRHQFRTYYYGNFTTTSAMEAEQEKPSNGDATTRVWRTFDHRPRFGTTYVGLRNRIAILSEAYSYLDFKQRIEATEAFVEEVMRFVAANAGDVRSVIASADEQVAAQKAGASAGVGFELRPVPGPVNILVGAVETKINPRSGRPMTAMVESTATPTPMIDYGTFAMTRSQPVPRAYVMQPSPDGLHDAIARLLTAHGIRVEQLVSPTRVGVEQFAIATVTHAERPFQGHHETSLTGKYRAATVDVPAGSLVVRTNQHLGRLVFYLLEPESDDGLTTWNVLDSVLSAGGVHPVLKIADEDVLHTRSRP